MEGDVSQPKSPVFRAVHLITISMNVLGMVILVLMMLLTTTDVVLRYFFSSPLLGSTEITEYMMVCLALGVPYCTLTGKAVSMDLINERFPKRVQAAVNALTDAIGLAAMVFLSWQLCKETVNAYSIDYSSPILNIAAFPFFGVLAFSMAMMCVALVMNIVGNIAKGVRG